MRSGERKWHTGVVYGESKLTQTEAFVAQVVGTLIAVLIVAIPVLWRLRGPLERIIQRLEDQSSVTAKAATETASQMGEVSKLLTISQQQLDIQQQQQQYMIEANTSLRDDRDEQKRRLDNVQAQFNEVNNRLRTYSENLDGLTTALEKSEAAKADHAKQIGELVEKVNALGDALNGTKTVLQDTQAELEKTKADLAAAKQRITDLESQRDAERQTAASEKLALETELRSEREKVTRLETQVNDLQKQVADLQAQLDAQKVAALPSADPDPTTPMPGGMPNGLTVIAPESKP